MALLELSGIEVWRDGRAILRVPKLALRPGFWAVIGPNGAGKTTLLKLLAGLLADYQGEVRFRGESLAKLDRVTYAERVQYVFQQPAFLSGSVRYNLEQPLTWHGWWNAEKQGLLRRLLQDFQLADRLTQAAASLSGGEAQRLGLLRALLFEPQVLLADEPTANVDAAQADLIISRLRQMADAQQLVIVSTHDQDLIRVADQVLSLKHGELSLVTNPS